MACAWVFRARLPQAMQRLQRESSRPWDRSAAEGDGGKRGGQGGSETLIPKFMYIKLM
jgi:hypothetical protein